MDLNNIPKIQPTQELPVSTKALTNSSEALESYKQAKKSKKAGDAPTLEIMEAIKRGLIMLGIKNAPTKDEWAIYVREITTYHKFLTVAEIELAFTLAIRQELNFDPETYQNFNLLYLNKMLAAYKQWAIQQHREIDREFTADSDFNIYEKKSIAQFRSDINDGYQHFLNGVITSSGFIPFEWAFRLQMDGFVNNPNIYEIKNKLWSQCTQGERIHLVEWQGDVFNLFVRLAAVNAKNIYK
jgi:hypothetical protein